MAAFDAACGLWLTVNCTYGITRLVSFGKEPTAVPLDLVSHLVLGRKRQNTAVEALEADDHVTLSKGPFANFVAAVGKIAPNWSSLVFMELVGG